MISQVFLMEEDLNGYSSSVFKLKAHDIGDGIINWVEQWLTDIRQRVVVDGEVSNWK